MPPAVVEQQLPLPRLHPLAQRAAGRLLADGRGAQVGERETTGRVLREGFIIVAPA